MTNNRDEELSAMLDGELSNPEVGRVLDAIVTDSALAARWGRYLFIGDAIRGQLPAHVNAGFLAEVEQRLEAEPPILAPAPESEPPSDRVDPRNASVILKWSSGRFFKPLVGLAAAASVAAVALILLPGEQASSPGPAVARQAAAPQVASETTLATESSGIRWTAGEPAVANKLNRYLVNHNAVAPSTTIRGMIPYATLVGYESKP